ncbi:hypothetical protein GCM10008927_11910 [Amylibacter ulvae]|uniref:50S ribosomal protein L29 n=1 Tax=Paramylibacter ulvae TaxID=1651968 RepID=A0ABQ3D3A6_9RHOB|nr:hypothetical protein [Amylibacter ulvae]GHA48451.1 hypothetical protein GCM10008927_11910 [Amylibacter ulvae]
MTKTLEDKKATQKKLVEELHSKVEVNELRNRDAVARMGIMEAELRILQIRKEIAQIDSTK